MSWLDFDGIHPVIVDEDGFVGEGIASFSPMFTGYSMVGYTGGSELILVAPGVAVSVPAGDVVVTVAAQPSNAVPGPLDPPRAAAEAAARQAARFADVVYQLTQPTERGTLLTTLATGSDGQPAALPLAEGRAPLWRFAAASYVAALPAALARAAAAWQAASHPATEGGEWVVSLTLSSWLDPVASRPLLVIDRLVLPANG